MSRAAMFRSDDILGYIVECYEGVELVETTNGVQKPARRFMWADDVGEVWIGNTAAFAEHLAERFSFHPDRYDYVRINDILLGLGERVISRQGRARPIKGVYQQPMQPRKEKAE